MKELYHIANSTPTRGVRGYRVHEKVSTARAGRDGGAGGVSFDYECGMPSESDDVLEDNFKQMQVGGNPQEDKKLYDIEVYGTVDDSAEITMEGVGEVGSEGSGAGVPIKGKFEKVPAGLYGVFAEHANSADVLPRDNVSFIHCTVGEGVAHEVEIEPDENEEPGEDDTDCEANCDCDEECECDAQTEPGGVTSGGMRAAGEGAAYGSTSGGSGVRRITEPERMGWSVRFGHFRGLPDMQTGRLQIATQQGYEKELGTRAGLEWQHPLGSVLEVPHGYTANAQVTLRNGNNILNFMLNGLGSGFFPVGATQKATVQLACVSEMSNRKSAACGFVQAKYIRALYTRGDGVFYDKNTGACQGMVTHAGLVITAEEAERYIAVVRDMQENIRQVWSLWDGLADVVDQDGGYDIRIYPPSQVSARRGVDGLYSVTGEPVRVFSIRADDAQRQLSIREKDATLPASYGQLVTTWRYNADVWSFGIGEGEETVWTRRERAELENGCYSVTTWQEKNGQVATCVYEEYRRNIVGVQRLVRTEGYGSPGAQTTRYTYNNSGKLINEERSDGWSRQTVYDEQGRPTIKTYPWAQAGDNRTVETTYRSGEDATYSNEPERVCTRCVSYTNVGELTIEEYTYITKNNVRRVEKRTSGAGTESAQLTVEETWLAYAPLPHTAGRPKMKQAANGVQTFYDYAATTDYGALYSVTEETRVAGELVPGQSTRRVSYVSAEGNTLREEDYVLLAEGSWAQISGATHTYNALNRLVKTVYDNGRQTSQTLTCQGLPLKTVDEDGIVTTYAYNSARQLIETTRSAVFAGEQCVTPEIITEYERDAADRITRTTTHTGAMRTVTTRTYDLLGRVVQAVDELGRITTTTYSEDGLVVTTTTPSGATLINTYNPDGSLAAAAGTGQRKLHYRYDFVNGLRSTTYLADGATILSQQVQDGFGQTITETAPTTAEGAYIYTRSVYNEKGQLTRRTPGLQAPTLYTYDAMGNPAMQTLLLAAAAPEDATKNRISTSSYAYTRSESGEVYRLITTLRNNPDGEWLTSSEQSLVSQLSPTLASEQLSTDERGHTTTARVEYGATGPERLSTQLVPTSNVPATRTTFDGFTTRATDTAGITTTYTRRYMESGLVLTQTDGRGNTTTTQTDLARRPIRVTDAAGYTTETTYSPCCNSPATITNALGLSTCYAYDVRGQKIAEYGTATQPATFAYDDAGRLIALTTWRMAGETIATDPRELTGGDTTTWEYDDATGLELAITYADGRSTRKAYDANNRLFAETSARDIITTYTWDLLTGLCTAIGFSAPDTTRQTFAYNIYGQLTRVADAAGERSFGYDVYGSPVLESMEIGDIPYALHELVDTYGRAAGYRVEQNGGQICGVSTGYAADGRIGSAAFAHFDEAPKTFTYSYLPGSNLLQQLTMPNGMSLQQAFEEKRNLLSTMSYMRGASLVVRRSYAYDALARPTSRRTERRGGVMNESFAYNDRSELIDALRGSDHFAYAYDNIGNRTTAQEQAEQITYATNALNQYTQIDTAGHDFEPEYDEDGNQTLVQTSTGIWHVAYNAQNRAVRYTGADGATVITCGYDYMGRRFEKKVEVNGEVTLHQRYLYHGYLQIAALDMTRSHQPALWYITWDPSQPIATRPLAIQKDGTWYTYGWDLTKNITELFTTAGQLDTDYVYTPYGQARPAGNVTQPIQWSSEYHDSELGLVYYNFRYYNPQDGRWTRRDPIGIEGGNNMYSFCYNLPNTYTDGIGLKKNIDSLVSDNFNRYCCKSKMLYVKKIVYKPLSNTDHVVGHAALECPDIGIVGKYPKEGCSVLKIIGKAEIRNDSWMNDPQEEAYLEITSYTVCPETLKLIQDSIRKSMSCPGIYSLACSQCENWVNDILEGAMAPCEGKKGAKVQSVLTFPGTPSMDPEDLRTPTGWSFSFFGFTWRF